MHSYLIKLTILSISHGLNSSYVHNLLKNADYTYILELMFSVTFLSRQIYVFDILETLSLAINLAVDMVRKVFAPNCGQILICHFLELQECVQI